MLILVLILAFLLYVLLYFVWTTVRIPLDTPTAILRTLHESIFTPQDTIFMLLRGVILVTALYVITDFLLSSGKRALRRNAETKEKSDPNRFQLKKKQTPTP